MLVARMKALMVWIGTKLESIKFAGEGGSDFATYIFIFSQGYLICSRITTKCSRVCEECI